MEKKRFLRQIAPLLVSLLVIGGMSLFVRFFSQTFLPQRLDRLTIETLPEVPDIAGWPTEFAARLEAAYSGLTDPERQIWSLTELARLYHANGFLSQAQACYLGLENVQPENGEWPYMLAMTRMDYGDASSLAAAAADLRRSLELDPEFGFSYLMLGEVYVRSGNWEAAEKAFSKRLQDSPQDGWAMLGIARVALAQRDWQRAKTWLLDAVAAEGADRRALELLPDVYQELGDIEAAKRYRALADEAVGHWEPMGPRREALLAYCYDPYRLLALAEKQIDAGDPQTALLLLERAQALAPEDAATADAVERLRGAMDSLARGTSSEDAGPEEPTLDVAAQAALGARLLDDKQYRSALEVLAAAHEQEPTFPGLAEDLATASTEVGKEQAEAGNFTAAAAAFRQALAADPERLETALNLGLVLSHMGETDEAVSHFERFLAMEGGRQAAYLELGDLLIANDLPETARRVLEMGRERAEGERRATLESRLETLQ